MAAPALLMLPAGAAMAPMWVVVVGAGILSLSLPISWVVYGAILALPFDNLALRVGPLGISVSDALLVVATLRWLLSVLQRGGGVARSELYAPAALFYVLLLPSFAVTFDRAVSLRYAFTILMMLLTAIVAANLLRGERQLVGAVTATLVASMVISLLALAQFAVWMRYHVSPWQVITDVVRLGTVTLPRLTATYFDPNYFALYLIVPIVLGIFVATERGASSRYRRLAWLAVSLDLPVFVMTFSRGGWVTLLAFMAAFVVLRARTRARLLWVGTLVTVLVAAPLAAAVLVRMNPVSISNRWSLLNLGLEVMTAHPLIGTGLGTFRYLPQNILDRGVHSTYLEIGADAGIPALLAFLALMTVVGFNAIGALRAARPGMVQTILLGSLFALTCVAIQSAWLGAVEQKYLWMLVGLTSAAAAVARADAGSATAATALQPSPASG